MQLNYCHFVLRCDEVYSNVFPRLFCLVLTKLLLRLLPPTESHDRTMIIRAILIDYQDNSYGGKSQSNFISSFTCQSNESFSQSYYFPFHNCCMSISDELKCIKLDNYLFYWTFPHRPTSHWL
jgi:hypothetical protein